MHDYVECQERPHQRHHPDQHGPVAGEVCTAPGQDVQVGDRDQEEQNVPPEEAPFTFGRRPAYEKIAQEKDADHQLHGQVALRKTGVVSADDFPRDRGEQDYAGNYFEYAQGIGDFVA